MKDSRRGVANKKDLTSLDGGFLISIVKGDPHSPFFLTDLFLVPAGRRQGALQTNLRILRQFIRCY